MKPVAVITGTTHGIGRVTALQLARADRHVVMLCRDIVAAEYLAGQISAAHPGASVDCLHCDLARLDTVRACARALREHYPPPELLINNAGVAHLRNARAPSGMDLNFQVNHLGHFLLTEALRSHLAPRARIVIVASRIHYRGELDLAAVCDPRERIRPTRSYARSKLANVLHTLALARRLADTTVTVNCLHPGVVATHLLPRWLQVAKRLLGQTILTEERGADTTLHLALSADMAGVSGQYFDEFGQPQRPSDAACDIALQETLWQRSVAWTEGAAAD
jgi:NAD(P)-dependent dehydrogenase (short-subunit alcohol dehydrogenase family)